MKSVRNAARALALLKPETPEIGVSEVGRALGLTRSSASRLLASLSESGLIQQDPVSRRYRPGPLAAQLGALYQGGDMLDVIRQSARDLASLTGHSTWIAVLDGREITVLDNVHGGHPVRYVVEPGSRLPAHTTAIGKALLARLDDETICELYAGASLQPETATSLASPDALLAEIHLTRKRGYAVSDQENFSGIKSFAVAPTKDAQRPIGLGLSFPLASLKAGEEAMLSAALLRQRCE